MEEGGEGDRETMWFREKGRRRGGENRVKRRGGRGGRERQV